jgi:hypothetical protein
MHTNSVFDELGLVRNLTTRSRTADRETSISKKNREMQSMQRI